MLFGYSESTTFADKFALHLIPQAGIKIAGRNINNIRYADDTTLWQKAKRN